MIVKPCAADLVTGILDAALTEKTGGAGRFEMEALTADAVCMAIWDDAGQIVGAYVLKAEDATLWIRAAAGRALVDLTRVMNSAIDHQARQFDRIGFQTRRAGLIRKAQALGYVATGQNDGFTVMEKRLK